ncbi:MAG: asparagine synthase C-terminal domain-containing protein, partial [Sulfurovum sp.]|nr:asparagine synthase C-terminal domain-containing protein [Sulfurovum sp.]
ELSGGFDSSSVFCIASQMHSDVTAFVMDFDQPSCNESHYADAVLSNCNSKAIRHNCSNLDYKNKYNMAYNYALSPHWPLWITFTMFAPLMEIQRERGINTVFTGQFGDHVLFGHPLSIANYLYQGRIDRFLYEWFKLDNKYAWSKMALSSMLSPKQKNFLKKLIGKKTIPAADNPSDTKKDVYGILSVLRQDRIDRMSNNIHAMSSNNNFDKAVKEKYGINYIDPLGDDEIVNFLFSLPYEFFFSQGNYRHFHIEAMRDLLPQKVIERKDKAEFSVIVKQQIAAIDRKELWEDSNIVRLGIIDNDMIDKFEAMFLSDTLEGYNLQQYWRMLNLEFWYIYNQYMDKD